MRHTEDIRHTDITPEQPDPTSIFTPGNIVDIYRDWQTECQFWCRARLEKRITKANTYTFIPDNIDESKYTDSTIPIYSFQRWTMTMLDENGKDIQPITWNKRYLHSVGIYTSKKIED